MWDMYKWDMTCVLGVLSLVGWICIGWIEMLGLSRNAARFIGIMHIFQFLAIRCDVRANSQNCKAIELYISI